AGLSRRSPKLALAMLVAVLSLGGIPPFAGFIGKLLVFTSAVQSGMVWLAAVGAANAIVGLYYYLNILKVIYLYRSEDEVKAMPVHRSSAVALAICVAGILVLGVVLAPWFNGASSAAISLIHY
ncbi:MAG: proton-conducting transporter membrane subunit, partial [Anaerolineaceae bacterium]